MQHHRALVRTSASWSQFLFRLSNQIASNSRLSTQSRSLIIGSRSMGSNHLNLSGSAYNSIFSTSVRSYSSGEGQSYTRVVREDFVPTLMQMPLLTIPNPIAVVWNWIYFKYRMPEMDPTFEIHAFLTGAKKVCFKMKIFQNFIKTWSNFHFPCFL